MVSDWTSSATTPPSLPDLRAWLWSDIAPYVRLISSADYAGWRAVKPWEQPSPVFITNTIAELGGVHQELEALRELEDNWNGYGGAPPSEAAIADARAFYDILPTNLAPPTVEPSGDGEVNLVWQAPGKYLEVGFYGDGAVSYYGKLNDSELLGDLTDVPSTLPKELRIALIALSDGRV